MRYLFLVVLALSGALYGQNDTSAMITDTAGQGAAFAAYADSLSEIQNARITEMQANARMAQELTQEGLRLIIYDKARATAITAFDCGMATWGWCAAYKSQGTFYVPVTAVFFTVRAVRDYFKYWR